MWPFSEQARPFPRGHKVTVPGGQQELGMGGKKLMDALIARVAESGAHIVVDANVKNLISDKDGRVVGVKYTTFEGDRYIQARRGVMLAPRLRDEYGDEPPLRATAGGRTRSGDRCTYSNGSGIEMGLGAGAATQTSGTSSPALIIRRQTY